MLTCRMPSTLMKSLNDCAKSYMMDRSTLLRHVIAAFIAHANSGKR